jgi:excisionase family DNA binding protein
MQNKNNFEYNDILTIAEVAALLRVHRSTVSRHAMSGELKSHLIGTRRLFKKIDVLTFFDNQEAPEYVSRRYYGNC